MSFKIPLLKLGYSIVCRALFKINILLHEMAMVQRVLTTTVDHLLFIMVEQISHYNWTL